MKIKLSVLLIMLFFGACRSPEYLSKPIDFKYQVKGLILAAELVDREPQIFGEIIEVTSETITILPYQEHTLMTVLKTDIKRADIIIATTSDNPKRISAWAGLINLAPLGHGFFLIVSVPINLVTTIAISNDAAKGTYRMKYPKNVPWEQMYKFARFPQGIPEHIDKTQIK